MAFPAQVEKKTKNQLMSLMEKAISVRPEWRFLEQQRHLQDVIRLLLRELESHHDLATEDRWKNEPHKLKSLTLSWLSLILSQELQHPPQLTKNSFISVFYMSMNNQHDIIVDEQAIIETLRQNYKNVPLAARQTISVSSHDQNFEFLQLQIFLFVNALYRLQTSHLGWDKPHYMIRPFLPFLNHITPVYWLKLVDELLELLEQHDSLLSFSKRKQSSFSKSHLHASHPLRKQAAGQVSQSRQEFQNHANFIANHKLSLEQLLSKLAQEKPSVYKIYQSLIHMQNAWVESDLFDNNTQASLELQKCLMEEASFQKKTISKALETPLHFLKEKMPRLKKNDQMLISQILTLFEVNHECSPS